MASRANFSPCAEITRPLCDEGEISHGLDRERILGSENAALAVQRLALHLLRFDVLSFAIQNPAQLRHRFQRLWVIRSEKAQASVQGTLCQFMSTRV